MTKFDAEATLASIQKRSEVMGKRKRPTRSRLDKYRGELLAMNKLGASLRDLQIFLKDQRVVVHKSTISRWMANNGKRK